MSTGPKVPVSGESPSVFSLTGAGAGSKNIIRGKVRAEILNSDPSDKAGITTSNGGKLSLTATDKSKIVADGGAAALALSLSSTGEFINLGFAVSVAINEITTDTIARLENSSVQIAGDLSVQAIAQPTIDALSIGGALTNGASFSGAGSGNTIKNDTQAYIAGGTGVSPAQAILVDGKATVSASDKSTIIADAGGISIALNIFSNTGDKLSGSVGVAAALNKIENRLKATISDTTMQSKDLTVSAVSESRIEALTLAGAGAISIADGAIFSFSGAGAGSKNSVTNTVVAALTDSQAANGTTSITTAVGSITVSANDTSIIKANAGGIAFTFGLGQAGSNINFSFGISLGLNDIRNTVRGYIQDANATAAGSVVVEAISASTIECLTIAGAGAIGLRPSGNGSFGFQMAGAGTGSGNTIDGTTEAFVAGTAVVNTSSGNSLKIEARDTSTIVAKAIAGSLSLQLDSGGTLAIGASIADNRIDSDVLAYVDAAAVSSTGSLSITATSNVSIEAVTVAAAISATVNPGQGVSLSGSGAGARSLNTITNTTEASARGGARVSTLTANDITIEARDTSTIRADSGGGSLAVSAQPTGFSGAFGISAALSTNTIRNETRAYIDGATTQISSGRDLFVNSTSQSRINAISVSVAGAVALTNPLAGFSLAMAGAGAQSLNTVDNTITSFTDRNASLLANRDLKLSADDDARIRSDVPAVSFVVSLGVGLSTSGTYSENKVDNEVSAFFGVGEVQSTLGDVSAIAISNAKVEAFSTAISLNISIGASGQGGKTTSEINGWTKAYAGPGARITATQGDVNLHAESTAFSNAEAKGGGLGLISVTGLEADSKITASTQAFTSGIMTISAGGLSISAKAFGKEGVTQRTAQSKVTAGTVAIVGGGGGKATSTVSGPVEAFIGDFAQISINRRPTSTGAVDVSADSDSKALADSPGGSGGGVTVTALTAEATTSGNTRAYVGRTGLLAQSMNVQATAKNWADAHILVANIASSAVEVVKPRRNNWPIPKLPFETA